MKNEGYKQEGKSNGNHVKSFAFRFSLVALIISAVALIISAVPIWDTFFRSSIHILLGKQIRLYVITEREGYSEPKPVIFASLTCVNYGGKAVGLRDTKLTARFKSGGNTLMTVEFLAEREVENFIEAEGSFKQYPVSPLVVLGKSTAVKHYAYVPASPVPQAALPESFDLEIDLFVLQTDDWKYEGTYTASGVEGIWQDLESGPPYKSNIYLIRRI